MEALRAIHTRAQAGRHAEAAALAQSALAAGLEHPLIYNVLALEREFQGQISEAEALLRQAIRIAPSDAASRNALGLCLLRLERPQEALAQFESLLAANPSLAFLHTNCGSALFALGRVQEAEARFQRALELDERQPVALGGLANIASSRGAYPAARSWAEKALQLLPGYPEAVLSLISTELGERVPWQAESRVREFLARDDLAPAFRAYGNGLLGDALDALGRIDEAFAGYSRCNEILRETHAPRFTGVPSALQYARSLAQYLQRKPPEPWRAPPQRAGYVGPAAGHYFILGFPRSGTTLLEVVLEGHDQIASLEENESLIDGIREFMQQPEDLDRLLHAPPATLDALRQAYWRRVAEAGAQVKGKAFIDKNPLNTLKLPLIARLFPKAKILFACRDPRDVVLSCFRHRFRMSAPIYELLTLDGAAAYYDAVMRVLLECTRLLPIEFCLVRHEDVVTEFAREMRRVCDFLGIEWKPAMGDFALRTRSREMLTPSTAQLVRGLNTEGLGHWRRYDRQLKSVLPVLKPWIEQFLYDP